MKTVDPDTLNGDAQPVVTPAPSGPPPALLFEMLRSFVTLARTLNISHAVNEMGSTRQTLRRHIAQLEELKGGALFEVNDRRYALSPLGEQLLPEAEVLIAQAQAWIDGSSSLHNGLQYLRRHDDTGWMYCQQQHPIGKVLKSTGEMLRDCLRAWAESGGDIEHEAMRRMRPYGQIFRRSDGEWRFTEVGELSSVTRLLGLDFARSTIGRSLGEMPGGKGFDRLAKQAYAEVEITQGLRLDHCLTVLPQSEYGKNTPVSFERLLMGSWFADGSFAVFSAVRLTYDVEIVGISQDLLRSMPGGFVME